MLDMRGASLSQERIDEFNAIFRTSRRSRKKKQELVWDSALGDQALGDYRVIPLTSSWALRQEGRAIRHCVGGYDELCAKNRARVFSIRDLMEKRSATQSLVFRDNYWHLEQVKGVENAEVCISEDVFYRGLSLGST